MPSVVGLESARHTLNVRKTVLSICYVDRPTKKQALNGFHSENI